MFAFIGVDQSIEKSTGSLSLSFSWESGWMGGCEGVRPVCFLGKYFFSGLYVMTWDDLSPNHFIFYSLVFSLFSVYTIVELLGFGSSNGGEQWRYQLFPSKLLFIFEATTYMLFFFVDYLWDREKWILLQTGLHFILLYGQALVAVPPLLY